ncbi:menaquinol-cytochrome c reductase cytochrome b/c subunit [Gracilibacillus ureilyticus]|uniref:Menaquinol-cytochrome c reductase cytochrome b/c subunit n=1 Tax=Gracilibacillus ureilyticus TaxID=531814 RepID=A0A1H9LNP1_9BACI|nr:menaquinol-cytochrome c reductase cytochrome b/c subunit [Gracilibacillus ureilyticus]SER12968.1 menaquinol-cytochrome c reductase cytochrome b/c subunit [Gracilibacillus ureilyticus]
MKKGKGMKFVGDSRVTADKQKFIPKDYSEYPGRTEAFWPNFLLKEWLVGAVFIVGFLCLTVAHPAPLEKLADPTDTAYLPLPDWYFLFLYQLLKYKFASASYFVLGAIVIPGLAFGALFLAPFLDKGKERRPHKRPVATSLMILSFVAVFWLTYEAAAHVDWEAKAENNKPEPPSTVEIDTSHPGYAAYENSCLQCHGGELEGGPAAPSLIGIERSVDEIKDIAVNGIGNMPPDQFQGTEEELQQLAEFIVSVNEQE